AIGRSRRCGKAPRAAVPDLRRRPDRPAEGVAIFIGVACSPHGAQRHAGILDFASLNPGYELRAYRACPGRSAARSDALQTRDRFDLWRSRISGAPLHFVSRCTAFGTRHGRELTWTRINAAAAAGAVQFASTGSAAMQAAGEGPNASRKRCSDDART